MISSQKFKKLLDFAYEAYQINNSKSDEYRQKGKVPFITHPLWCAMMMISDTEIPWEERELGFQALVLHDVLEDSSLELPKWVEPKVKKLVEEMTFNGEDFSEKAEWVLTKPINVKLLILYDGLSSMYELHVRENKRHEWKKLAEKVLEEVEEHYGNIRIIQVGKAIIKNTNW